MDTAEATSSTLKKIQVKRFKPDPDPKENYLTEETGLWAWMTTVDHKKIGIMFLASITFFFFIGGIMALLIRTELWTPAKTFIEANTYNQLFTLHGAIMIFLFLIPSVPAVLGNFVLPLQLGAKDVAFPRLNLLSFYLYLTGAGIAILSILTGGIDTGWTFYTPYSTTTGGAVTTMVFGVFIIGFSSILTGVNFIYSQNAGARPDMGQAAAFLLGSLCHQHYPDFGDAGSCYHRCPCWNGTYSGNRNF